ncbi:MAG: type II toxin-antitoxin system prevent-host-death family antitoxin [Chloroflexota bacterium]
MALQTVGIREFRTNLHKYTRKNREPITITSHGEPIGYYIPVAPRPEEKDFAALLEATKKISAILEEQGLTVEDIIADYQEAKRQNASNE